ncbi:Orotidine 5'-phosphate decarboxylase [hydrothermal vent metagenome]|uniref:Orotidine 5'-phosphate decarboxylase n=1 Tax=hydrothermal vent metagenome TaxID=652676 RepID=A0A3B0X5G3_9ZZZZ
MREQVGGDFLLVTPGIRPAGSKADDQRRVMSPAEAINAGSNYLVTGRPVTQSDRSISVLRTINSEIS